MASPPCVASRTEGIGFHSDMLVTVVGTPTANQYRDTDGNRGDKQVDACLEKIASPPAVEWWGMRLGQKNDGNFRSAGIRLR
jgi:hypothetical protein